MNIIQLFIFITNIFQKTFKLILFFKLKLKLNTILLLNYNINIIIITIFFEYIKVYYV